MLSHYRENDGLPASDLSDFKVNVWHTWDRNLPEHALNIFVSQRTASGLPNSHTDNCPFYHSKCPSRHREMLSKPIDNTDTFLRQYHKFCGNKEEENLLWHFCSEDTEFLVFMAILSQHSFPEF